MKNKDITFTELRAEIFKNCDITHDGCGKVAIVRENEIRNITNRMLKLINNKKENKK